MDYYVPNTTFLSPMNWAYVAPFRPRESEVIKPDASTEFVSPNTRILRGSADLKQSSGQVLNRTEFTTQTVAELFGAESEPDATTSFLTVPSDHVPTIADANFVPPRQQRNFFVHTSTVEKIAAERVQLMAVNYAASEESSEIIARLEILNQRLLQQAPRVTKEQVFSLEHASAELQRLRTSREERARRRGLDV